MPIFLIGAGRTGEESSPGQGLLGWRTGVQCRVDGLVAAMVLLVEGEPSLRSWWNAWAILKGSLAGPTSMWWWTERGSTEVSRKVLLVKGGDT